VNSTAVSALERVEAILRNSAVYELADEIALPDEAKGGRPRHYPVFMHLIYAALLSVYGSARRVEAELAHPIVWDLVRRLVRKHYPRDPAQWLPKQPMRRHHYRYGRDHYLTDAATLDRLAAQHLIIASGQARELGLFDSDGPGSWTHPDPSRLLHADGKVITPLFRAQPGTTRLDKTTGELRSVRAEPDGGLHFEGTGETAWGVKFVLVAARSADPHGRIILDIEWVPTPGGEAHIAMDCFTRLAPNVVGAQGIIYDTALRGVHHQAVLHDLGLIPINRVSAAHAAVKAPRRTGGRRVPKSTYLEDKTIETPTGEQTVSLYARDGALGLGMLTETGELHFEALPRVRTHRNPGRNGTYRWYNDYRLPDDYGAGAITVRLHGTPADTARKLNRTENLRPIPPEDPDFKRLYPRRNDAESINRGVDDSLWLGRAHSLGHARQHVDLLGYALMVNGIALQRQAKRRQPLAA
jgi:hypothetical protein